MGTRGCIARLTDNGFEGRYHHWDSYPEGLGATLYKLYHGHFNHDLETMLKTLIDDHPAGWSTINGKDFNLKAGFGEYTTKDIDKRTKRYLKPKCYCHGSRKEKAWVITEKNASGCGVEWVYAFDINKNTMQILASYNDDGTKMIGYFGCGNEKAKWLIIAEIDLEKKDEKNKIKEESDKAWEKEKKRKAELFLKTMSKGFAEIKEYGLMAIPKAHFTLWYKEDVSKNMSFSTKLDIAKRISELTLKSPIWMNKNTNYIDQFPELRAYSSTKHISGLQLCSVMSEIVRELQCLK